MMVTMSFSEVHFYALTPTLVGTVGLSTKVLPAVEAASAWQTVKIDGISYKTGCRAVASVYE